MTARCARKPKIPHAGLTAIIATGLWIVGGGAAEADMDRPEQQFMSLATSSVGGTWFPLGGAMASIISSEYPELNITGEVTGGTVDNLRLMGNDQVELALSTNDQAYLAQHGEGDFDEPIDNFSGVIAGHGIFWQLYALADSGIESIYDLQGRRVSLGAPGSIGVSIGEIVFEAHGLTIHEDWTPEYLGHGDAPGALRDRRIDAALIISSFPTGAVTDITSSDDVVFINPEPDVLEQLLEEHPYWSETSIPGGVYTGHPDDIPGSFGSITILIARNDLSDEAVYAIAKSVLENQDRLRQAHALGAEWTTENATRGIDGVIPFHPGAEAYLKEQGLL